MTGCSLPGGLTRKLILIRQAAASVPAVFGLSAAGAAFDFRRLCPGAGPTSRPALAAGGLGYFVQPAGICPGRLFWPRFSPCSGLVAAVMITLGAMGRIMALVMMFPLGFDMMVNGANLFNETALACGVMTMLLGTGALSLWQPEEGYMARRAGE